MITYFIMLVLGSHVVAFQLCVIFVLSILFVLVLFGLAEKKLENFIIATFLITYIGIDIWHFHKEHPWSECVIENVSITSETLGTNVIVENQKICRYRNYMDEPFGEWVFK